MSSIPEGPPDRRRSITPPRAYSPPGATARIHHTAGNPQCSDSSSGNSSFSMAAELLSEDLAQLLTQAETRIAADTRRHSVWHAVHLCACCPHSQQQQQQQQQVRHGDISKSRTANQEALESLSEQPGNHVGEQHQQKDQLQHQPQHLWAVYLWEGLEAPRYILDHARLRTLRLVEALESCEQRGNPISPAMLLPWASFAVLRPQQEGPRCWPTVEVCERRDTSGNIQEQQPVILDGEALLERNVLLLRLLLRLPRLAYGAPPSIPAVSRTAVADSEMAAAQESAAAAAIVAPAASQSEEKAVAASPRRAAQEEPWQQQQQEKHQSEKEQHQQEQEDRPTNTAPFVPRLALPSHALPRLQLQLQGSSPKAEEPLPRSGSSSNRRAVPLSMGSPQHHAADFRGSESSSSSSSVSVSPVSSSGEVSPAEGQGRGQQQQRTPSGPLRLQGGLRLQGVPKLAIPRLGGGGGQSPSLSATPVGAEAAGVCLSPQTRGRGGLSPVALRKEGERPNSRRSSTASGIPQAASGRGDLSSFRELAAAASSLNQQPPQQQQTVLAGARLGGASAKSPGGLQPSGLLSSPAASPGGLQCYSSEGSNAGSFRESFGSRRRRTEEVRSSSTDTVSISSSCRSCSNNIGGGSSGPRDYLGQEGMGLYSRTRQQQLVNFRRVISDVYEGRLFVSGAAAACDLECLKRAGITHVVNTIGDICPNVFASLLTYKTYYLKDTRQQDIMCVFYDCIRFISEAIDEGGQAAATAAAAAASVSPGSSGGAGSPTGSSRNNKNSDHSSSSSGRSSKKNHKVLIHCKEGVSRSATLAIAFLMWRLRLPFVEAFERMRRRRAICSPNTGFTYQLLLLQKRLGLRQARASISNLDLTASKDGEGALKSPASMGRNLPETPSSPESNRHCTTPGKGTKRAGSPLESHSLSIPSASGGPSPQAIAPRAPPPSITSLDLTAGMRADKACRAGSSFEMDDPGTPLRSLGPRAPCICAPPRPGGDRGGGSDAHPQGDSPFASIEAPAAVPPPAPVPVPAAAVAVAAAAGGTPSAVEDCVLLLHLVVHSAHSPDFLLWSEMIEWQPGVLPALSEQGVYMLRGSGQGWVWMDSSKCLRKAADVEKAARNYQENVALVERRNIQLHYISPGSEPPAFWRTLGIGEGTAHLGVPNLLSGLEPMAPEKSDEPFRWRDYCAFDLPADWGEAGTSEGAFIPTAPPQEPGDTKVPSALEGATEGPYKPREVTQLQSSSNSSSRVSSAAPSLRRSVELFGNLADGVPPETAAAEGGAAAKNAKGVAKLFCLPNLKEPLDLFDSEDLLPNSVFLLVAEGNESSGNGMTDAAMVSSSTATETDAVKAWLWVGAEAEFDLERDLETVKTQVMKAFNLQPGQLQLSLELEGEESETFWSHFANG
ncbi:hypothetical protein, conserved [Eimeria praecox]|uniref:Dual specificity phosphatase, catalytic domain-containing protein n=1 Tax=Eimeria praecox TaxID=51316 RepID=U6H0T5_9EIME|nr:hypothetical protein, conserved [Eimeria praecox]